MISIFYLQVGELYSSCHGDQVHAGRQSVAFHLNARPSAVLDFHDILEEAGHLVSDRHATHQCHECYLASPGVVSYEDIHAYTDMWL